MRKRRRLELKAARVRMGWTQLHLAIIMSVSQQTIAKWESGAHSPKSMRQIRRLGSILNSPMDLLFPDIFNPDFDQEVVVPCMQNEQFSQRQKSPAY